MPTMMKPSIQKLTGSIVIDIVGALPTVVAHLVTAGTLGAGSVLIPIAESVDLVWAPLSAALIQFMYKKPVFSIIGFVEELSPGLDYIPTATIAWFYEYFKSEKPKVNNVELCKAKFTDDKEKYEECVKNG